jgi:hypothetical protein
VIVVRVVSVRTGAEASRVHLDDNGTVTYSGGESARTAVRNRMRDRGLSEPDAIGSLSRDGWSNGYLMVALDQQ